MILEGQVFKPKIESYIKLTNDYDYNYDYDYNHIAHARQYRLKLH